MRSIHPAGGENIDVDTGVYLMGQLGGAGMSLQGCMAETYYRGVSDFGG